MNQPSHDRIRILLVDDHVVLREGTRHILEEQVDFEVVAETDNGYSAIELARTLAPDVVLMDIKIRELNGIEATKAICRECPETHVLALTGHDSDQYVRAMVKAGAMGYVLKSASSKEVIEAVRMARLGSMVFSADIAQKVISTIATTSLASSHPSKNPSPENFSDRELEILSLLALGHRNNQIAEDLNLSGKTVEFHLRNVFLKLCVSSRTEAILKARELHLVSDEVN